jgi:hypothetical protein
VDALKASGWTFASHSYGHGHMDMPGRMSLDDVKFDIECWMNEIKPVIGDTQVFIFAYGEWPGMYSNNGRIDHASPKFKVLTDNGFRIFCGVGRRHYFDILSDRIAFMDRANIDGFSLHESPNSISRFMNAANVICSVERIVDYWTMKAR